MSMALLFDGSLIVLILAIAAWTIAVSNSFAAIGYATYGITAGSRPGCGWRRLTPRSPSW